MADIKALERQIRILQQLTLNKELTVELLYELFERGVSKRTLQRDLIALRMANVPIEERRGAHGAIFWSLNPGYLKFIPMTIGMQEFIASLLLNRLGSVFKRTPIEDDIHNLNQKIKQLLPGNVLLSSESVANIEPYFTTLDFGYIDYTLYGQQLQNFLNATLTRRECRVIYHSVANEKPKTFSIHPYALLLHKGSFYGIVFQPRYKQYLHLLIHRIVDLTITDEQFERNPDFDLEQFVANAMGIWHENPEDVEIEFNATISSSITERIWQQNQQITKLPNGNVVLKLHVAVTYELVAWILRWGSFAKVLAPPKLIEMVTTEIKNLQKIYTSE